MSYREDSDIHIPYGRFVRKNTTENYSRQNLMSTIQNYGKKNKHLAKKLQNDVQVVQFVSNCNSKSGRYISSIFQSKEKFDNP